MKIKIGKKIGEVSVDSGHVMICDPCYIATNWSDNSSETDRQNFEQACKENAGKFNYLGACHATSSDENGGEIGLGVAARTSYGDGSYPVYTVLNARQQYCGLFVDFTNELEEEV